MRLDSSEGERGPYHLFPSLIASVFGPFHPLLRSQTLLIEPLFSLTPNPIGDIMKASAVFNVATSILVQGPVRVPAFLGQTLLQTAPSSVSDSPFAGPSLQPNHTTSPRVWS